MAKTTWVVRTLGWIIREDWTEELGWRDLKSFGSAREADEWLCEFCRTEGHPITDFTITRR